MVWLPIVSLLLGLFFLVYGGLLMFGTMATTAPVAIMGLIMFVSSIIGLRVDLTMYLSILCIVTGGIAALMGGLIGYNVGGWIFSLLLIMGIVSMIVGAFPVVILVL